MPRVIVFPEPHQVTLQDAPLPPPGPGQVLLRTRVTLISTGTEGVVFGKRFAAGTHWDRWFDFPITPGYSCVAEVSEGSEIPKGTRVVVKAGHASHHVVDAQYCTPIPGDVSDDDAVWFALAVVAFIGAQASGAGLADRSLVIGAGPVGQMAIRWLVAAGSRVLAAVGGRSSVRPDLALAGGAERIVGRDLTDADADKIDVVVDSTGDPDVFQRALGIVADHGRVVLLGDPGDPSAQRLSPDLITRGLTVVGAHGLHIDGEREHEVRDFFFRLISAGRFPMDGLVTHRFAPEECAQAYDLTETRRRTTMGVVFDWT